MSSHTQTKAIRCGEVTLECTVAGSPDRPLVVLLHGFPESRHAWRHQIPELAKDHLVVAPNLRGYGGSSRPGGMASYRLDRIAADVRELVRAMNKPSAHVVGHDWGGAVAWALAIDDARPANDPFSPGQRLVDKLAVLNCPHPARFARAVRLDPVQQLRSAYFGFFLMPLVPEWLLAMGDFAVLDALVQQSLGDRDIEQVFGCDHRQRRAEALPDDVALNAAVNYYRAAARFADEMRDRYAKGPPITRPTLLIWGEDDPALGVELTRGLEDLVPGAGRGPQIEMLAGCSHWPQQEEPTKVTDLLRSFLAPAPPATRSTAPAAGRPAAR